MKEIMLLETLSKAALKNDIRGKLTDGNDVSRQIFG